MGVDRTREWMLALFLLGITLLLPPLLLLFNHPTRVLGLPVLYLYVFATWTLLIALAALIASRIAPDMSPDRAAGEAAKGEGA
jgi:hypothetical protein